MGHATHQRMLTRSWQRRSAGPGSACPAPSQPPLTFVALPLSWPGTRCTLTSMCRGPCCIAAGIFLAAFLACLAAALLYCLCTLLARPDTWVSTIILPVRSLVPREHCHSCLGQSGNLIWRSFYRAHQGLEGDVAYVRQRLQRTGCSGPRRQARRWQLRSLHSPRSA